MLCTSHKSLVTHNNKRLRKRKSAWYSEGGETEIYDNNTKDYHKCRFENYVISLIGLLWEQSVITFVESLAQCLALGKCLVNISYWQALNACLLDDHSSAMCCSHNQLSPRPLPLDPYKFWESFQRRGNNRTQRWAGCNARRWHSRRKKAWAQAVSWKVGSPQGRIRWPSQE